MCCERRQKSVLGRCMPHTSKRNRQQLKIHSYPAALQQLQMYIRLLLGWAHVNGCDTPPRHAILPSLTHLKQIQSVVRALRRCKRIRRVCRSDKIALVVRVPSFVCTDSSSFSLPQQLLHMFGNLPDNQPGLHNLAARLFVIAFLHRWD